MEGHAGAGRLNAIDQAGAEVTAEGLAEATTEEAAEPAATVEPAAAERSPSRLSRRSVIGISSVLVVLAAAVAAGGYLAVRSHRQTQAIAAENAEAIVAAKDCVAATQAPDVDALIDAQRKIVQCSTGDFGAQAMVYSGMLTQAYQAADVHVKMSEIRAAVERNNPDRSIQLLVAMRVKIDNIEAQGREFGYRLRVQMTRDDGQFKIAELDQVAE